VKNPRRSVEHDGVDYWVGWPTIMDLYEKAEKMDKSGSREGRHGLYFAVLFELGARVGEILQLRPDMFQWNRDMIVVRRVPVFKRRRRHTRNVYIKREGDPLSAKLIEYVQRCDTKFLLPGFTPFTGEVEPSRHVSAATVYNTVTGIDPGVWPHWLRDQRSWQLSAPPERGGRGFDAYLLKAWFEWGSLSMPAHYAGRRSEKDILAALGVDEALVPKQQQ